MEKRGVEGGKKGWWDEECKESKEKVWKELKSWKRRGRKGESYRKERRRYKKLCDGKKKRKREEWEREVESARTERQVWKIVNRERKNRGRVNESIEMGEWDSYFKMLRRVERRIKIREKRKKMEDGEEKINRNEIKLIIKRMKDKKAAGEDGIPNEV